MNILDCITYFDEDTILDLRLNILYEHVTKFIITEGEYDHRGRKRKFNFDIKKYSKFSDKIIYFPVGDFKNLKDPWSMLEHQRNYSMKAIKDFDDNTFVLVSDVDEIPDPEKIYEFVKGSYKFGVFEQLLFYYKLNLLNITNSNWHGSKICKKKQLKNPNWLREYKINQYTWWIFDKPTNIKILKNGGWHFSFLYDIEGIIKKISSYQHTEFDKEEIKNRDNIINKINNGEDIFNRNFFYKKIPIDNRFPDYIKKNQKKFSDWIKQ